MADWEKVGQALSGGANILAGGMMDREQRKRDLQDWEQKQKLTTKIQMDEEERRWAAAEKVRAEQAFRESLKKDIETNPELQPFMERRIQGDPEAERILSIYAGSKYKMFKKTPLSSDEVAGLAPLPPGVRHNILQSHLGILTEEQDKEFKREKDRKDMEYRDAQIANLTKRTEQLGEEKADTEARRGIAEHSKMIEERGKGREAKQRAIQQLDTNILTLQGIVGDKVREKSGAKKGAGQGIDLEIATIQEKITQAEKQKARLEADIQREADVLRKTRPDLFPEEAAETPPRPGTVAGETATSPTGQVFIWDGSAWLKK